MGRVQCLPCWLTLERAKGSLLGKRSVGTSHSVNTSLSLLSTRGNPSSMRKAVLSRIERLWVCGLNWLIIWHFLAVSYWKVA